MNEKLNRIPTEVEDEIIGNYNILETVDFFTDQLNEIQNAQKRIWIQTMALESGHFSNLLAHNLIAAEQRGVDVRIVYDAYSDYVTNNTFNNLPLLYREDRGYKQFLRDRGTELLSLLKHHCKVSQTNIPSGFLSNNPFNGVAGRDHKKMSIIDDKAYIGGVNMTPIDAQRVDFMLKTNNQFIVNKLSFIFNQSFYDYPVSDTLYPCDNNNTLLVDSGERFKSTIMEYAYEAIDNERDSITLISPFVPSGKLKKTLNTAVERGVHVELITSQISQLGFTPRLSQFVHNMGYTKPLFQIHRYPGIVHAKALLLGNHSAIIGSHNFDELFVKLGTEEISLLTTQPEILIQLNLLSQKMKIAIDEI